MMQKILLIALAGSAGALCRYGLTVWVHQIAGSNFPWGTFACNMIGSFLFGFFWILTEEKLAFGIQTRLIILTGFMGSFTTFSTFMYDSGTLMQNSEMVLAMCNLIGQCLIGLVFLFVGMSLAKMIY